MIHTVLPEFTTVLSFIFAILTPFFLALILYYLMRPIVRYCKTRAPPIFGIFLAYVVLFAFFGLIVLFLYPKIQEEILGLEKLHKMIQDKNSPFRLPEEMKILLPKIYDNLNNFFMGSILAFLSSLATFLFSLFIALFIVFYFLKDDNEIYANFMQDIPADYKDYVKKMLEKADEALQDFVNGRVIVSAIISALLLFAFILIGLDYAFLLAAIAFVFYIIPTIGCFLAMVLPLIVGFSMSLTMGIEVLVIMTLANVLEGFLVTPQVIGKELFIHPVTMILIILVAGSLFGVLGLLLSTPAYILLKIFVVDTYRFFYLEEMPPQET